MVRTRKINVYFLSIMLKHTVILIEGMDFQNKSVIVLSLICFVTFVKLLSSEICLMLLVPLDMCRVMYVQI